MTGTGTQADPYIISTWSDLIDTTRDNNSYCEWTGGDLDFNDIRPAGYDSRIDIKGNIDFHNATFKNFRHLGTGSGRGNIWFENKTYMKNLNFLNFYMQINSNMAAIELGHHGYSSAGQPTISNCKFSGICIATSTSDSYISSVFDCDTSPNAVRSCSFNIQANAPNCKFDFSRGVPFKDCRITVDITQKGTVSNNWSSLYTNCLFEGRWLNNSGDYVILAKGSNTSNSGNNVYRFDQGAYTIDNHYGQSVFDTTNATLRNDSYQVAGCTAAQLTDASYLRSIGFPVGVN